MMGGFLHILALVPLCRLSHAAFYYPDPQGHFLEHILVDNWGAYASNFSSAITPCDNYVTEVGEPAVKSGRTTAAQWIRVAFHDFVTANVSAGTGGIDGSIGFETLRSENSGSAFNDSFTFWRPFVNDAVSMADLVAAGPVMSMALCGGQKVPYRPGRIDAAAEDPTTGVPAPETDLDETLVFFDRSGFNQSDSIGLTACGHTIGSVHHGGFPDVVPESAVTVNNTNGGLNFDTTRAIFDQQVVHEYIDGARNMGGPLVTTGNVSTRSDLRLYESDGNATMQSLYDLGDGFQNTCVELMGRMIDTVPGSVTLQGPISPMEIKPINVTFDFDSQGQLIIAGRVRLLSSAARAPPSLVEAAILTESNFNVPLTLQVEPDTGRSVYGNTTYYTFSEALDQNASFTSLRVSGIGLPDQIFNIQNEVFIIPSMTAVIGTVVNTTVAARPGHFSSSSAVDVAAPIGQQGTLGPRMWRQSNVVSKTTSNLTSSYDIWQSSVDVGVAVTGAVSVRVGASGEAADVLYLDAGVAGW